MSNPNPERDQRVRQIRERWSRTSFPEQVFTAHVKQDIDCLFSLLDSQAAGDVTWSKESPKVDGVYWWRADRADFEPDIHSVVNGRFYEIGESFSREVEGFGGEWLGPITPEASNDAATRMRDRCVQKVREHAELCRHGYHDARNELLDLIGQLQSLTLEGEQEKRG